VIGEIEIKKTLAINQTNVHLNFVSLKKTNTYVHNRITKLYYSKGIENIRFKVAGLFEFLVAGKRFAFILYNVRVGNGSNSGKHF
jgi:hypothetical protein